MCASVAVPAMPVLARRRCHWSVTVHACKTPSQLIQCFLYERGLATSGRPSNMTALPYGYLDFPMAYALRNVFAQASGPGFEDMRCAIRKPRTRSKSCEHNQRMSCIESFSPCMYPLSCCAAGSFKCIDRICCLDQPAICKMPEVGNSLNS